MNGSSPSQTHKEAPMETIQSIGVNVHKKSIVYCIKTVIGKIVEGEGKKRKKKGQKKRGKKEN